CTGSNTRMPTKVGIAMDAVPPIQVAGIDTTVKYAAVEADGAAVEVIDSASAPVPASIPAVIPPAPQRDPGAKREQAAGNGCGSRFPIYGVGVVLGYINLVRLRRHDRNVTLINRDCLLRCGRESA